MFCHEAARPKGFNTLKALWLHSVFAYNVVRELWASLRRNKRYEDTVGRMTKPSLLRQEHSHCASTPGSWQTSPPCLAPLVVEQSISSREVLKAGLHTSFSCQSCPSAQRLVSMGHMWQMGPHGAAHFQQQGGLARPRFMSNLPLSSNLQTHASLCSPPSLPTASLPDYSRYFLLLSHNHAAMQLITTLRPPTGPPSQTGTHHQCPSLPHRLPVPFDPPFLLLHLLS